MATPDHIGVQDGINYNEIPAKIRRRPYYVVLPGLIILIGIMIPFVTAIALSCTNYSFKLPTTKFVFLKNWIAMFSNKDFYHALSVTLRYAIYCTGIQMILGTIVAFLLKADNWFTRILKVLFTFPLMVAPAIAVLVWQLMTSNSVGVLEKFLNLLGVFNFPWAASKQTAMFTVVLIDTWVNMPFVILLVSAGINSLPKSPFEAAQVDGAGRLQRIWHITLPGIRSTFIMLCIISVGSIMSAGFDQIYIFYNELVYETGDIIDTYVYRVGLEEMRFGLSTAVGLFKNVIGFILVYGTNRLAAHWGEGIW